MTYDRGANIFLKVHDSEITAIPRAISDGAIAASFGISVARVRKIRARNPEGKLAYRVGPSAYLLDDGPVSMEASVAAEADAREGSAMLLRAQLKAGQHFFDMTTRKGVEGFRQAAKIAGLA